MPLPRDIAHGGDRPQTIADEQEQGELQIAWQHADVAQQPRRQGFLLPERACAPRG